MIEWDTLTPQFENFILFKRQEALLKSLYIDAALDLMHQKSLAQTPFPGETTNLFQPKLSYADADRISRKLIPETPLSLETLATFYQCQKAIDTLKKLCEAEKPITRDTLRTLYSFAYQTPYPSFSLRTKELSNLYGVSHAPVDQIPELLEGFLGWFNATHQDQSLHPVHRAAETAYAMLFISPFESGHAALAHLMANLALFAHRYPPVLLGSSLKSPQDQLFQVFYLAMTSALQRKAPPATLPEENPHTTLNVPHANTKKLSRAKNPPTKKPSSKTTPHEDNLYRVGPLARLTGISVATLRYWTDQGLLKVDGRSKAGYRLYAANTPEIIQRIQALKKERYNLNDIKKRLHTSKEASHI